MKLELHIDILEDIGTMLTLYSLTSTIRTHTTYISSVGYTHMNKHFKINQAEMTYIRVLRVLSVFSLDGLYARHLPLSRHEKIVNITL